jgi:signal transduction histidine kinase
MLVRKKDPTTVPRAAFEVMDSAQQAVGLVNDLLDLSRLDEDRLKPVIRATEPTAVAKRAIVRVTPAAEARRVRLQLDLAPQLPDCETDASRVEQILINLLGNAINHAPEGSTVGLQVSSQGSMMVYVVQDEGTGIEESQVERIFDIYESKPPEEGQGVGLGLPLSRRLARLLGGELRAVAKPNQGGYFVLELPLTRGS